MPNAYADSTQVTRRAGVSADDLGLSAGDFTAFILALNERASESIEAYCNRDFLQHADHEETHDGSDNAFLVLREYPVLSVAEVLDGDDVVDAAEYRVTPSGCLEHRSGSWAPDWNRYTVTYTHGYATVPLDVVRVAEDVVIRGLQSAKADRAASGAASISMDGYSVTYDRIALAAQLLPEDKATLAKWRKRILA